MPVFAYTHYDYIRRVGFKQFTVSFGFLFGICGGNIYIVHAFERNLTENMFFKEISETLRRVFIKTDIFVHVVGVYPRPVDRLILCERFQYVVLRRRRRENHIDFGFRRK